MGRNSQWKRCRRVLKRNRKQITEAAGNDNMWFAGIVLGRQPTRREGLMHYFQHGGPQDFARRHPC